MSTDDILAERGKTHGEYADRAACTQEIMRVYMKYKNWAILSDCQKETLHMMAHKVGRILTGDPDIPDHWDDIAGYVRLVSQRLGPGGRARTRLTIEDLDHILNPPGDIPPGSNTQAEPGIADEEELRDGITTPREHYLEVSCDLITYWIVDREYYSDAAIEHLPKLCVRRNHYEWINLPPWYRGMYITMMDGSRILDDPWIARWAPNGISLPKFE